MLFRSSAATGNQWYEVGVGLIAGATQNYFVPDHNGSYYVIETDANGCASISSDTTNFIYASVIPADHSGVVGIFPNPAHNVITISLSKDFFTDGDATVALYDVLGQQVMEKTFVAQKEIQLSVATLAPAVYLVEITGQNGIFISRIEKW